MSAGPTFAESYSAADSKPSEFRQPELARKVGMTQSVIARLEDAEYAGHSLTMLERIAAACGVTLELRGEKKPHFDREVALA
jgi:transcriptional regulator with XRE-family HTH domain